MTTLHDRLAELADDAPPGGPEPDLWDRAVRYHRRRRAGTVVIAAASVVLLALMAGVSWQRSAPAPVPADGPVGLPDRVWTPNPWLPTVDRPGQLVAVSGAERGTWTGMHPALVGISATSGDYAFFDLPDADLENGGVELAPDGRHAAYWLTGPTTDTPNSRSGPITGIAVYDATTGEVTRHWISTPHGLMPDFLAWADAGTVVYSAGQVRGGDDDADMDQGSSSFGTVTSWPIGGEPRTVPGVESGASLEGAGHGRILVDTRSSKPGREHLLVDVADPADARYVDYPDVLGSVGTLRTVALDSSGRRIALVPGDRNPHQLQAGPFDELQVVTGARRTFGVVDWLDADTVVTLRSAGPLRQARSALFRVDVSTGDSRQLVRLPGQCCGGSWQFATDLLAAPSVEGMKPPSPLDPRVTVGLSLAVVLGGVVALWWWRRRVRA